MTDEKTSPPEVHKRLVFMGHPDGIPTILGYVHKPVPGPGNEGVVLSPMVIRGYNVPFSSLTRSTARMHIYREPMIPGTRKTFDPRQA